MKRDRNMPRWVLGQISLARKTSQSCAVPRRPFAVATLFVLVALLCAAEPVSAIKEPATSGSYGCGNSEQALGKAAQCIPGDVYKVSLPRSDLQGHRLRLSSLSQALLLVRGSLSRRLAI